MYSRRTVFAQKTQLESSISPSGTDLGVCVFFGPLNLMSLVFDSNEAYFLSIDHLGLQPRRLGTFLQCAYPGCAPMEILMGIHTWVQLSGRAYRWGYTPGYSSVVEPFTADLEAPGAHPLLCVSFQNVS